MKPAPLYHSAPLSTGLSPSGIVAIQATDWPRQATSSRGTCTPEGQPQRIVLTGATLIGSPLAIDTPMIASGATTPSNRVADDQGFLRQWSKVAKERKLQQFYVGEPSAEAAAVQMPDLILISATGGGLVLTSYDQLSTIASTLTINYDGESWRSLLTQLGGVTGYEKQAAERIVQSNKQPAATKERIKLPPQLVIVLIYTAAVHSVNLRTSESVQGQMPEQPGSTLAKLPVGLNASQSQNKCRDITQLSGENLAVGPNGESLFLLIDDQKDADTTCANPLLAHLPVVQSKWVYTLGTGAFRLNCYSAMQVLDRPKALS